MVKWYTAFKSGCLMQQNSDEEACLLTSANVNAMGSLL